MTDVVFRRLWIHFVETRAADSCCTFLTKAGKKLGYPMICFFVFKRGTTNKQETKGKANMKQVGVTRQALEQLHQGSREFSAAGEVPPADRLTPIRFFSVFLTMSGAFLSFHFFCGEALKESEIPRRKKHSPYWKENFDYRSFWIPK